MISGEKRLQKNFLGAFTDFHDAKYKTKQQLRAMVTLRACVPKVPDSDLNLETGLPNRRS
jgi:hypothetical protein